VFTISGIRHTWNAAALTPRAAGCRGAHGAQRVSVSVTRLHNFFCGYELGQFGKIGPAAGLALSFAIYSVQVLLSLWWLRHFRSGPMESNADFSTSRWKAGPEDPCHRCLSSVQLLCCYHGRSPKQTGSVRGASRAICGIRIRRSSDRLQQVDGEQFPTATPG